MLDAGAYKAAFNNPRKYVNTYWLVFVAKQPGQASRLGLAIAKKVLPKAVSRNRIKRLVREVFRHNRANLLNHDYVVLCRKGLDQQTNTTLQLSLKTLLLKSTQ
jgi:ribonuclease P protein component